MTCKYFDEGNCKNTQMQCKRGQCPILGDCAMRGFKQDKKRQKGTDPAKVVDNIFEDARQAVRDMNDAQETLIKQDELFGKTEQLKGEGKC